LHRHKRERDKRVADRLKAVLLRDDGWALEAIAEALFLSHEGIRQHLLDYNDSGKLAPESGGSDALLNEKQTAELLSHLDENLYIKVSAICDYTLRTQRLRNLPRKYANSSTSPSAKKRLIGPTG